MLTKSAFPLLLLNMFLANLSMGLVIPFVPELLEEFSASGQAAGYLVSCFGLTQFLFSPIAGNLSDRYGRKPMIIIGLVLFALSNLLAAFASDLTLLFASRLIGGIGSAALIPSIIAYIADITADDQRSKSMSWLGASMRVYYRTECRRNACGMGNQDAILCIRMCRSAGNALQLVGIA